MIDRLSAGEVCSRSVVFVERRTHVNEAARLMREHHVGTVVVVDDAASGPVPVGMLTDRDIVTGIVAKDIDARRICAEDAMGAELLKVREHESMLDVLESMRHKGVRRAPVVDAQGRMVGVLSIDDMLEVIAGALQRVVQTIEGGRKREQNMRP